MEELLKKIAEHSGYAAPFGYAVSVYGFFHWVDKELSDEAKAALARTMRFADYKNEQIASALVEVFDRIYAHPLLRWRAFFRSLLFTIVLSAIWAYEGALVAYLNDLLHSPDIALGGSELQRRLGLLSALLFNVLTDYLSLFVIRPLLVRSGTKPVIGLILGTVTAVTILFGGRIFAGIVLAFIDPRYGIDLYLTFAFAAGRFFWAAVVVFIWLPLLALGILIVRLLTPLSLIVGGTQWLLKEGKDHPLKAIGYVAAIVVFLGTVAWQANFSA